MTHRLICFVALGAAVPAVAATPEDLPHAAPAMEPTVPAEDIEPRLDMEALEKPPPSAWDRREGEDAEEETDRQEGISWGEQLLKTVVALAIVVGIIYLLFRVGLARFVGMAAMKGGKTMKVLERVQLDARHALLIVELDGERRFLLGTGERGIQMLARLDRDDGGGTGELPAAASFQEAMAKAAGGHAQENSEDSNA